MQFFLYDICSFLQSVMTFTIIAVLMTVSDIIANQYNL